LQTETQIASSIFDKISNVYDKFLNLFTFGLINKWQYELIEKTPYISKVLDIGTGTGELIKKIKKEKKDSYCVGIDLSFQMLLKAKEKLKDEKDVFFIKADIYNPPFKQQSFDNIFLSLSYRHLEHKKLIRQTNQILKKEGYISIFDTAKLKNKTLWKGFLFTVEKIFRPIGYIFFSKEEYDYFVESLYKSFTMEEIINLFDKDGYDVVYKRKIMFGLAFIVIFKKR